MAWNLKIVPRGLLLSKYVKNIVLVNPDNVKGVERSPLLTDQYQTFNQANNTANITFQLAIFNNNPQNEESEPTIVGINYVQISNDPTFQQVFVLIPTTFASAYSNNTDYFIDLNNYDIAGFSLPASQTITFATQSGIGNVNILNWPLSGSSGAKKVYIAVSVLLSNGASATYPQGLDVFDELVVCSSIVASPETPKAIGATLDQYVSAPLYYEANTASNAGNTSNDDSGVASYFWDGLILNSTSNLARNNYSQEGLQLFKTAKVLSAQLNQEKLPIAFSTSTVQLAWSPNFYRVYRAASAFKLTTTNNIYFFEAFVNNYQDNLNYVQGQNFFYEFNVTNSTGATKYLRQQLAFNNSFKTVTIYTSADDVNWATDTSNIPTAFYNTTVVTNPDIVAQITGAGIFVTLVEVLSETDKIYQAKLIFKPQSSDNNIVISETIFTSNLLTTNLNVYGEFRFYIQNATYTVILESTQYGICQGTISAAVMPNDKINTDYKLLVENNTSNFYTSQSLNTWFTLNNSPSAGVTNNATVNGFPTVQFYNNQANDPENNIAAAEIQSAVPTFSNEVTLTASFNLPTTNPNIINTAYSFDSNLAFDNFTFDDLLKTSAGITLPQSNSKYNYYSAINYSGTNQLLLNVFDVGAGQTCSITTTATSNLFFYSQENTTGNLTPPFIVRSIGNLTTSATFSAWIGTNEPYNYSTSTLITNLITVQNQGNVAISINTGVGLGINTIAPGQPYVATLKSINPNTPNTFIILSNTNTITSSANFLYDFGQLGTISSLGLTIQIATPPECPANLPSFKYSVEVSDDFINWTYVSSVTAVDTFSPTTGNLQLLFTFNQTNSRYARLRLYYDVAVTFDPRQSYRYSLMTGAQTPNSLAANSGKFIVGFTDVSAKNSSLGQLYNQPTFMRQYVSNTSTYVAIVFDFSDYQTDVKGPVYLSLLTNQGEKRFYTIVSNFNMGLTNTHVVNLTISKKTVKDAFYLQPRVSLSINNTNNPLTFNLDDILTEPNDTQNLIFGYYPLFSLVGNGNVFLRSSLIKGTYNTGLDYSRRKSYFSLFSGENVDYTASYGKNLLKQNTFGIATYNYPQVDTFFQFNTIKGFYYENITFTVKAVFTSPAGLFGPTYTDGVYLESCDYVLLTGQLDKSANGVYQVQTRQWVKKKANPTGSGKVEPTVLVTEGNVFGDTLWMLDTVSTEWICNAIACPFVLDNNNLLFTGISSIYKYPQFIKLGVGVKAASPVNSLNQVKLKLLNSPAGYIRETDLATQWNSLLQNGELYSLQEKANSNNTIFMNFGISSSQISSISTNLLPATYNMIVSFAGNYIPSITANSDFVLPEYGKDYRLFTNPELIYQLFSTYEAVTIGTVSTSIVNASLYALSVSNVKTPQTGFSTDVVLDNTSPTIGILSKVADNAKSVYLSISTAIDTGAGLSIARVIQKNPAGETLYGSWFGFNTNSLTGISSVVAYPSFVANQAGITTGEPLSGYYRYSLQVADKVGNLSETNQVESFYFESALVDTQGPSATVNFVNSNTFTPISFTTSTVITTQLLAQDSLSDVKAFRYRILPNGQFGNWLDYNEFAQIFLPESIEDGILSIQFQFKDFGNNVLYSTATVSGEQVYVYTWNIVSKLISNVLFTVTESTTFNDNPVLLVGASKSSQATLYVWDNSKLIELTYPGLLGCQAITAMLTIGSQVIIATENGKTFVYENGIMTGPFASFTWGETTLPISKFEVHQYPEESTEYVYATTLNIPRIFRTPTSNLKNLSWQVVQTLPVSVERVDVVNSGLWSGTSFFYSISSSYQAATLTPALLYGISTVVVTNAGSNINSIPNITVGGPMTGVGLSPVLQGYISKLNLLAGGVGYTAGATVTIQAPASGGTQATGYAITNSNGQIISIGLNVGGQGYGYTNTNPAVTISGNLGIGSQAVASATTQFDSIYSVNVTSAGIGTTTNISLSAPGGAILTPTFLYRVNQLNITNPGFGYTSTPQVLVNGLSTIASATAEYGSIQSVTVTGAAATFPLSLNAIVQLSGGVATNWVGTLTTSAISFSTGALNAFPGFVLSSVSVTGNGFGFGVLPSVSFSTSISTSIYNPELKFILSDDITLFSGSGSIYDIKSFDNKLFFTSSQNGIIQLGLSSGVFNASQIELNVSSNNFNTLYPYQLSKFNNGLSTNLYFSVSGQPFVGRINKQRKEYIFEDYENNILIFKPYNFDILSNWQLKKIINTNGVGTASYGPTNDSLSIYSKNAQVFYESTKDNTWFERCKTSSNYAITLNFEALEGTQCLEISTFDSTFKSAFTFVPVVNVGLGTTNNAGQNNLASYDVAKSSLVISFGDNSYQQLIIDAQVAYSITFVKSGSALYIYNNGELQSTQPNFFTSVSAQPVIRFGNIFEPTTLVANNQNINTFGTPSKLNTSRFIWKQMKFTFNIDNLDLNLESYSLNLPYVVPNASSVRVLKTLDNNLYAVTKSIDDDRSTSELPDVGSKVYRLQNDTWLDVTGIFETYNPNDSTSFIITSPNDINNLNNSFFITGTIKNIQNRTPNTNVLLGLSTSVIYEQSENLTLIIIFPRNANPAGESVNVSSSNSLISVPNPVYFPSGVLSQVISIGVGSTSTATSSVISVTDGINTSIVSATIIPIGISSVGLNTSTFVAYTDDQVIANVQLTSIPQYPVSVNINSTDPTLLKSTLGIVTVPAGSIGIITSLTVGVTTTKPKNVSILASYRSSSGIATITAQPFVFSFDVNNKWFVGNQGVTSIAATASINRSPIGILTVNFNSSGQSILGAPTTAFIVPGSFSTSQTLTVGSAVSQNTNIFITALIPGSVSTSLSTATPFTITSATSSLTQPVFGLQTATITFSINSTPLSNVLIRNVVSSTSMLNMVFPSFSTVQAGSSTTSFGISTGIQYAQGLAVTIQGAPFGFNTSPSTALTLLNDRWRVTNLIISPNSIVGRSANADGSTQQFGITATLNVGLGTVVYISASIPQIDTRNINFGTSGTGSATSIGYSTGLSTSAITGFAITARGPYGLTTTVTGLTLNPFLISSFTTSYIWNGVATGQPAYTVGGIAATAVATITLNAYVLTGVQTVVYSTIGTFITRPGFASLGISSIVVGSNSTSILLTSLQVPSSFTTSITAQLVNDGISTTFINIQPIPSYFAVFDPIVSGNSSRLYLFPSSPLPVSLGVSVTYSNGVIGNLSFNANVTGISTDVPFTPFGLSTIFVAQVQTLGIVQTYYATGYSTVGGAFAVGYNYYGELSKNYPVIGPLNGSSEKVYMGLSSVLKTASGYHHNLALDERGRVFSIGLNTYNQLGYNGISTNIFYQVGLPTTFKARDIFAQRNSSYVITADNNLYSWGSNNMNALGTATISISTSIPYLISTSVQLFSAYEDNATYITYNNKTGAQSVYQFGAGRTLVTGIAITQLAIFGSSRPITNLFISALDQGPSHTVAAGTWQDTATGLNSNGVFAWGSNAYYQTGFTSTLGISTVPNILIGFNTFNQKTTLPYNEHIVADYNFSIVEGRYIPTNQGYVAQVEMQTLGIGYTTPPLITFSSPPDSIVAVTAIGTALINNLGKVSSITINDQGSGYLGGAGVTFSPPTGITSNPITALGTAIVSGNQVINIHITNPGFGYTAPPVMIISPTTVGGGAIGIVSIIQGEVIGVIISNPGFGYTQTALVSISSSVGSGATALVNLASSARPVSNFTLVGSAVSSNSAGFGLGLAATNIGNTLTANTVSIDIHKIIKNPLHYFWLNSDGNVITSGGAIQNINVLPARTVNAYIYLYASNNSGLENSELYSHVFKISTSTGDQYVYRLFGYDFYTNSSSPLNYALQPSQYLGAYSTNIYGGFAASVDSTNYLNVFYHDTQDELSESWQQAAFIPSFVDLTLTQADITQTDPRAKRVYVTILQSTSTGTTISIYICNAATETTPQSFNSNPVQVFISRANATKIASAYINHYRGEYFTKNGITYSWIKSDTNIAVGYNDGTIELYGNALHYSVDGGIVLISSWIPNGYAITTLDTVCDWQFPNLKYLFAGTSNGQIYCYNADGDPLNTYIQTQLSINQSPKLLNTLTLPLSFGYITAVQNFFSGVVMASTSTNLIIFIRIQDLKIIGYIPAPGLITSFTSTINPENISNTLPTDTPVLSITVNYGSYVRSNDYYLSAIKNYEMGLDYANIAGAFQTMTTNGTVVGTPSTSIVDISTNDTFTVIVDSSKPNG